MEFKAVQRKDGERLEMGLEKREQRLDRKHSARTLTAHKTEFRRRISETLGQAEHLVKHPTSKHIGNSSHVETKRDIFSEWIKNLRQLRNQIPELQNENETREFSKGVGYFENLVRIANNRGQDYAVAEHLRLEVYSMLKVVRPLVKNKKEVSPAAELKSTLDWLKVRLMSPATADFRIVTMELDKTRAILSRLVPQTPSEFGPKPVPEGIIRK